MKANTSPTYATEIIIWSRIGHCPLTNRKGAYCDELYRETIQCDSPASATARTRELIARTAHAERGHFNMPDHPNQNTRSNWVS